MSCIQVLYKEYVLFCISQVSTRYTCENTYRREALPMYSVWEKIFTQKQYENTHFITAWTRELSVVLKIITQWITDCLIGLWFVTDLRGRIDLLLWVQWNPIGWW
jgi:hypothetical protein